MIAVPICTVTLRNKGSKSRKQANSFTITTAAYKGEYTKNTSEAAFLRFAQTMANRVEIK